MFLKVTYKYILAALPALLILFIPDATAQEQHFADSMMQYYQAGNYKAAIIWGEKNAEAVRQKVGDTDTLYGAAIGDLGVFYFLSGNYEKPKILYKQSGEIIKLHYGENNLQYATSLNNEATLYKVTGDYNTAESLYNASLRIYKSIAGEENADYARSLDNLAVLYYEMGNYNKTEKLALNAIGIRKKILAPNDLEYGISLNTLGSLYTFLGNYKQGASLLEQALIIFREKLGEKHPDYVTVLGNLSNIYFYLNDLTKATKFAKEDIAIKKEILGEQNLDYATALNHLADIRYKSQDFRMAGELYKQVSAIQKNILGTHSIPYATTLSKVAINEAAKGNYKKTDSIYKDILITQKQLLGQAHPAYFGTISSQAELFLKMKRYAEAGMLAKKYMELEMSYLKNKLDFLSEKELVEFLISEEKGFSLPHLILFDFKSPALARIAYDSRLLYKGLSVENVNNLRNLITSAKDSSLTTAWKKYRQNKFDLANLLAKPILERLANTDSLASVINTQEKELLSQSAAFRNTKALHNISYKDVKNNLKAGEAAIEFVSIAQRSDRFTDDTVMVYAAMILRPKDTVPVFVKLCHEKQLQRAMKKFAYKAASQNQYLPYKISSAKLKEQTVYELVWRPMEPYLKKINTVYFAPSGTLHQLAFAALPFKKDSLLIDKYKMVQLTSTRQLVMKDYNNTPPASVALFGGIDYNNQQTDTVNQISTDPYSYVFQQARGAVKDSFSYLRGTYNEIVDIKKQLDVQQKKVLFYNGTNASEAAFRNLGAGESPEAIHLATHGFALPANSFAGNSTSTFKISSDPMLRSGLVLAGGNKGWKAKNKDDEDDGILTAMEISAVQLTNTKLAVLSACETATGELLGSEGIFGLQRAFKLAGVNYIMASLWQVPDKETAIFMNLFYNNWLAGNTIQQAFDATQKTMRKKYAPYYWAAFTLVQ